MAVNSGRFAVADVGSNTVHLLTAECDGRHISPIHEESARLRLGADVARAGSISPANIDATIETVERFVRRSKKLGVDDLRLLGTHPIRRAANSEALGEAILRGTGVRLRTLTPDAEALLGYMGTTLDYPDLKPTLVVDVGGGSTQLSVADKDGRFTFTCSAPVGTVNLPVQYLQHDPPGAKEGRDLRKAVSEALKPIGEQLDESLEGIDRGVLIGGLARRLRRAGRLSAKASVSLGWLERVHAACMALNADGLSALGAARKDDAGMLRAGSAILVALMQHCQAYSFALSHYGLREGAVLMLARGEALPGAA